MLIFLIFFSLITSSISHTIQLDAGWNLISGDGSLSSQLIENNPKVLTIWGYEDSAWKVNLNPIVSTSSTAYNTYPALTALNPLSSYFVFVERAQSIKLNDVTTTDNLESSQKINEGWSSVGNISDDSSNYLESHKDLSQIWGYKDGKWQVKKINKYYTKFNTFQTLHKLSSERGYFAKYDNPTNNPYEKIMATVRLGYLANSEVDLFKIGDSGSTVYVSNDSSTDGTKLDNIGHFETKSELLQDDNFYLYQVSNGENKDFNNDNLLDTSSTNNKGMLRLIISGKHVKQLKNNLKITFLSELLYNRVRVNLNDSFDKTSFNQTLTREAKQLLTKDINLDGTIDQLDVYQFDPVYDIEYLSPYYKFRLDKIIANIHDSKAILDEVESKYTEYYGQDSLRDVVLSKDGSKLFLSDRGQGLEIFDISNPTSPTSLKVIKYPDLIYDILLSSDNNKLYLGHAKGLTIYDISNIFNPIEIGKYSGEAIRSLTLNIQENYLYFAGDSSFAVLDITNPRSIIKLKSISLPRYPKNITLSHNEKTAYISNGRNGLHIIDLTDSNNISLIHTFQFSSKSRYGHSIQNLLLSQDDNVAYIANMDEGLYVLDVSDRMNPQILNHVTTNGTTSNIELSDDYSKIYVSSSQLLIYDITNPIDLKLLNIIGSYSTKIQISPDESIIYTIDYSVRLKIYSTLAHHSNGIMSQLSFDQDFDKMVFDSHNKLFYLINTQIVNTHLIDVQDPLNPQFIKELKYFDLSKSLNSKIAGTDSCTYYTKDIFFGKDTNKAYLLNSLTGLSQLDTSNPKNPKLIKTDEQLKSYYMSSVTKDKTVAYLFTGNTMLIADVSIGFEVVTSINIDIKYIRSVVQSKDGNRLLIAGNKLGIFDISDKVNPTLVQTIEVGHNSSKIILSDDESIAYLTHTDHGLTVIDLSALQVVKNLPIKWSDNFVLSAKNNKLFILSFEHLNVIDITSPKNPIFLEKIETKGIATHIKLFDDDKKAYIVSSAGLQIIDLLRFKLNLPPTLATPKNINIYRNNSTLTLRWDSNFYAKSYEIYFSNSSDISVDSLKVTTTNNFLDFENLNNNQKYFFKVQAVNNSLVSTLSNEIIAFPVLEAPFTPKNLKAQANDSSVLLTWDRSLFTDKYKIIYTSEDLDIPNSFEIITINNEITINELQNFKRYKFKIQSMNAAGVSAFSPDIIAIPQLSSPSFFPPDIGDTLVRLSWSKVPKAKSYNVYYGTDPTVNRLNTFKPSVNSSIILTGLQNNTNYYAKVISLSDYGESDLSDYVSFQPTLESPFLNNSSFVGSGINLSWSRVIRAESYKVYYSNQPGVSKNSSNVATSNNFTTLKDLQVNSIYYIKLESINSEEVSALSTEYIVNPNLSKPAQVQNLQISPKNNQLIIAWENSLGATSYQVQISEYKNFSSIKSTLLTSSIFVRFNSLENYKPYYIRIKPSNDIGEGEFSKVWSAIPAPSWTHPILDLNLTRIPAGHFDMGQEENSLQQDTKPVHKVTLSSDFYIGKYEVTNAIWDAVMNENVDNIDSLSNASYPKDNISWTEIVQENGFLDQLNKTVLCDVSNLPKDESRYHPSYVPKGCFRLPTEAEWEYMAQFLSNDLVQETNLADYAWIQSNNDTWKPHTVGLKKPNPLQIYDVLGNVSEWVYDFYTSDFYHISKELDPINIDGKFYHVIRGGNWTSDFVNHTKRDYKSSNFKYNTVGFRLLAVPFERDRKFTELSPTNLKVQQSGNLFEISWTPQLQANYYKLYYSSSTTVSVTSDYIVTNLPYLSLTHLNDSSIYYFKVSSGKYFLNESPLSETIISTPLTKVPDVPQNLLAKTIYDGFNLSWSSTKSTTQYKIYYASTPNVSKLNSYILTSDNYIHITDTSNNLTYFRVASLNNIGESDLSQEVRLSNEILYPQQIELMPKDSAIEVYWKNMGTGFSYRVYYSKDSEVTLSSAYKTTSSTKIVFDNLDNRTIYNFRVLSILGDKTSLLSPSKKGIPLKSWIHPEIKIDMIRVPSGEYLRGSNIGDYDVKPDQIPKKMIQIPQDFYIGKFEITQKQWLDVIRESISWPEIEPSPTYGMGDNFPAYNINYNDIVKVGGFLDHLNMQSGCNVSNFVEGDLRYNPETTPSGCFRLPSESEWEYLTNQDPDLFVKPILNENGVHRVEEGSPNSLGIYNLYGNVSEWLYDYYNQDFYSNDTKIVDNNQSIYRSIRGINWQHKQGQYSTKRRAYDIPKKQDYYSKGGRKSTLGFRVAFVAKSQLFETSTPTAPSNITGIELNTSVKLHWKPTDNTSYYKVFFNNKSPVLLTNNHITTNNNEVTINGLSNSQTWYFKIQAINIFGNSSELSSEVSFSPKYLPPPDPTNVKAKALVSSRMMITSNIS